MAKRIAQPGLFDEPIAPAVEKEVREWREVRQDVFLGWSPIAQIQYCMNRDLASAALRESEPDPRQVEGEADTATWYSHRAAMYAEDLKKLRESTNVSGHP